LGGAPDRVRTLADSGHFHNPPNFTKSGEHDYDSRVLGNFARRVVELAVLFFAAYAFAFVPLGSRTGLEHCRAILDTRAAREAGRDVGRAADRLRQRLFASDDEAVPGRGTPVVPALPRRSHPQAAVAPHDLFGPDASM
jgi:hypothetical protein